MMWTGEHSANLGPALRAQLSQETQPLGPLLLGLSGELASQPRDTVARQTLPPSVEASLGDGSPQRWETQTLRWGAAGPGKMPDVAIAF